ncbi:ABC transporter permease subunit [Thermogladius sp. 4427co]|uniref:ABC transporter permease subunit n=1 Tax=Thermogladius sp. 4427co TaxID=3450718 RepID=UPI003F7997F6
MDRLRRLKILVLKTTILLFSFISILALLIIHIGVILNGARIVLLNGLSILYASPPLPNQQEPIGGLGPSLVSTLITSGLAILLSLPLAIFIAYSFVEYANKRIISIVRYLVTSLYGIPTITISVVVYYLVVVPMRTQSMLAGVISLLIVSLPMLITYFENIFSSIPLTYREAGYSIGLDRFRVLTKVVIGISKAGLASAVSVTLARLMGETAPLLFTIGNDFYSYPTSLSSLLQPSSTITTLIFTLASSPFPSQFEFAWGAAFVLYVVYLTIFALTKLVRGVEL